MSALSFVRWNAGQYAAARAAAAAAVPLLEEQVARHPDDFWSHYNLASSAAAAGRRTEALAEAERVRAIYRPEPGTVGWSAYVNLLCNIELALGNNAAAVDWVDTLLHLPGTTTRASIKIDPIFAPLRSDPRFLKLAAQK